MPEGDWLKLVSERLWAALGNSKLTRAELRWPSLGGYNLRGYTVTSSRSYGKNLLIGLTPPVGQPLKTPLTLHWHLRMDGVVEVAKTGSRQAGGQNSAIRCVLANSQWTVLGYRLGMMHLLPTRHEHQLLDHLGPDVLASDFDSQGAAIGVQRMNLLAYASSQPYTSNSSRSPGSGQRPEPDIPRQNIPGTNQPGSSHSRPDTFRTDTSRPLCQVLLDQRVVAGIGTIWMAETLWALRLWPWTPVTSLSDDNKLRVLLTASRLMQRSVVVARTRGIGGVERHAHGQLGKPCSRCRCPIALNGTSGPDDPPDQGTGNRVVFWCPGCQAG